MTYLYEVTHCFALDFKKVHIAKIENFPGEIGGPKGPEPTRFGDWERKGRVTDF